MHRLRRQAQGPSAPIMDLIVSGRAARECTRRALLVGIGHFLMVDDDRSWGRFDDVRRGKAILYPPPDQIVVADRPERFQVC